MAVRLKNKYVGPLLYLRAGSGGIAEGQLGINSSGEVIDAPTGDVSAATLVGLALKSGVEDAVIPFVPVTGVVFAIDTLQSATKKTCTDSDLGTAFDMDITAVTLEQKLNLDDTTGGHLTLVGYDNDRMVAYVMTTAARVLYSV